jgi:hypothetical protein
MVEYGVLCHKGGSGLDHQRLACTVVVKNRKINHKYRHGVVFQTQIYDESMLVNMNVKLG